MRILKSAEQKNVTIDRSYLSNQEIYDLMLAKKIFFWQGYNECYNYFALSEIDELHIFTCNLKELKIIYDKEYECYQAIAVFPDGQFLRLGTL